LVSSNYRLETCSNDKIHNSARNLVAIYAENLNESLGNELIQFSDFAQMFKDEAGPELSQEQFMYGVTIN
jgi:hypothetical protein